MKQLHKKFYFTLSIIILSYLSAFAGKNDTLILDDWAKVKSLVGKAEVRTTDSAKWRSVHVGMKLKMEWDLRTHKESSLELSFPSGNVIKLRENSIISLSTLLNDKDSNNSDIKIASEKDTVSVITITDENKEK